ncbi:MAG: hypothetical protein EZS28_004827 [Streblomastix strix]|uniref:Uncharacterized protein n=1 Tax=Streblomastix strix TaxID=222440 RepID=A0A5J4WZ76_9EUKA|nr:MAG: hypothetical protein EZS28_004827 [Streblomastix strix]
MNRQNYQVHIKRSPLPIAHKLKRKINLRASQDSEIAENTSYAFGIKFNCLCGVVTSSEFLLTGNVFDKLSISGTKDDAEKRALKRAERRREEIVKQNEKRRTISPKTSEQQLPPIYIVALKIDDLQISTDQILVLVSDTKTIHRLVSQKKESQQQLITFPASITNGSEAGTFQEQAEKLTALERVSRC